MVTEFPTTDHNPFIFTRNGKDMVRKPQSAVVHGSIPALLWKRIAAFFLDLLMLEFLVFSPFHGIFAWGADWQTIQAALAGQLEISAAMALGIFVMGLIAVLYFALCESFVGQTLGKLVFGLRVAGIHAAPGFWRCFVRSLFLLPLFPFALFWIIDPIYMFFSKGSQRFLERLSGTVTIESNPFAFKISTVA